MNRSIYGWNGDILLLYYVIVWGVWVATIPLNEAWFC